MIQNAHLLLVSEYERHYVSLDVITHTHAPFGQTCFLLGSKLRRE